MLLKSSWIKRRCKFVEYFLEIVLFLQSNIYVFTKFWIIFPIFCICYIYLWSSIWTQMWAWWFLQLHITLTLSHVNSTECLSLCLQVKMQIRSCPPSDFMVGNGVISRRHFAMSQTIWSKRSDKANPRQNNMFSLGLLKKSFYAKKKKKNEAKICHS